MRLSQPSQHVTLRVDSWVQVCASCEGGFGEEPALVAPCVILVCGRRQMTRGIAHFWNTGRRRADKTWPIRRNTAAYRWFLHDLYNTALRSLRWLLPHGYNRRRLVEDQVEPVNEYLRCQPRMQRPSWQEARRLRPRPHRAAPPANAQSVCCGPLGNAWVLFYLCTWPDIMASVLAWSCLVSWSLWDGSTVGKTKWRGSSLRCTFWITRGNSPLKAFSRQRATCLHG